MEEEGRDYRRLAGEMVERARKRLGVSQTRFGELLGAQLGVPAIHRGQIGKYEGGEQAMPAYYLLAIKDLTELSLDRLFEDVDVTGLRATIIRLEAEVERLKRGRHTNDK